MQGHGDEGREIRTGWPLADYSLSRTTKRRAIRVTGPRISRYGMNARTATRSAPAPDTPSDKRPTVSQVENDRDDKHFAHVRQSLPQPIVTGSGVCEDGPEIGWPVLAGVSQSGTDGENGRHRRLDKQAKGERPIDTAVINPFREEARCGRERRTPEPGYFLRSSSVERVEAPRPESGRRDCSPAYPGRRRS